MNIFQIEQELLDLFDVIEQNEGEITPEIEEALSISQDNFTRKVEQYANVLKKISADLSIIKDEKDRLKALEDSKKRTKERLTKIVADAITMFGDTTKSGGKFIDYGTGKVSVRNTNVCEADDNVAEKCVNAIWRTYQYNNELKSIDNVDTYNAVDINELIKNTNEWINAGREKIGEDPCEEAIEVTVEDLDVIDMDINISLAACNAFSDTGRRLLKELIKHPGVTVKPKVNKTIAKNAILDDGTYFTVARIRENKSLTIK